MTDHNRCPECGCSRSSRATARWDGCTDNGCACSTHDDRPDTEDPNPRW